jgi:ribosomal protein S18 acetylase RimI-like enzyme
MPLVTDPDHIRTSLRKDPIWAAYALGDLSPESFPYCRWHHCGGAIALVFRRYETPILWTSGEGSDLTAVLEEVGPEPRLDLQVREEALPALAAQYEWFSLRTMMRMAVRREDFRPAPWGRAQRLSMDSLPEIEGLYADGLEDGTSPDYFFRSMLDEGVFFGVSEAGELVSVAGTHVLALEEGIAAVGNVYTRRDRRGCGYAARATSAVLTALFDMGVGTAVLNVNVNNGVAARVYERLGFRPHCRFREGIATKKAIG